MGIGPNKPSGLWLFGSGRLPAYFRGLLTSYGSMGVVFLFTAITVPLGISSMGLEGWGIWVFCQQASAAICLFESFTQSAFVRLLIQVKDDPSSESYKKMVWMGRWSFWAQGVLLLALHAGFAAALPFLFPNLGSPAGWETIGLMGLAALVNQAGKINGQLLYAHQHQDRGSLAATTGLLVNLGIVMTFLPGFPTPQTMGWAFLGGAAFSQVIYLYFAHQTKCRPTFSGVPNIRWPDFQPFWFWGRHFFFYSFFGNLSSNLPTLLAGRFLSPGEIGIWGVLQKIANMMSQTLLKVPQLAGPALMEMHAQGDELRFRKRSFQILTIQNVLAALGLGVFASTGTYVLQAWLGQTVVLSQLTLLIFALALFAEVDQRFRLDVESLRLLLRRPLWASVIKIALLSLMVPLFSKLFGLDGLVISVFLSYTIVSLVIFILPWGSNKEFQLPIGPTWAGYLLLAFIVSLISLIKESL